MKKLVLAALLALTGCQTANRLPPLVQHRPAPVENPVLAPTALQHVEWKVRDLAGLKELVAELEANGDKDAILYILPQDQFNILAMNVSEMKRYLADQKAAKEFLYSTIDTNSKEPPAK